MGVGAIDLGIAGLGPATPFARGGFATVYRAEQLSLRREVAVKVLEAPPDDQVAFSRFERECHALGAVSSHPNIVVVHDGGLTADGRPYLIMEYEAGGSLADALRHTGVLAPARVREIGIKISDALAVAHDAGVVHRDVKPANILLSAYGEPALADFGIARIDGGHRTTTGNISASVAHAAREVLAGDEPSTRSDVYSLGSTLLELSTGRTPYQGNDDSTVWQLINRIMHQPPLDAGDAGVPEPLATVLNTALDPEPANRFASARDFQHALVAAEIAADAPAVAPTPSNPTTGRSPSASPDPGPAGPETERRAGNETLVVAPPATTAASTGSATAATEAAPAAFVNDADGGRRRWPFALGALVVGGLSIAALFAFGVGLFAPAAPMAELVFSQALVEPLEADRTYALAVRDAPADSTYQLLVDDEPVGEPVEGIVGYRAEPGRHRVAVAVTWPDGTVEQTDAVDVYVSPGPPQGGYRVNLAAVRVAADNWPLALRRFDELVDDGHEDLVLSVGGSGDIWAFYIDGYGPDADAAWAYCERFELGPDDCFAAEVPVEDE